MDKKHKDQVISWARNVFVGVDINKVKLIIDPSRSYPQNKALIRRAIKKSDLMPSMTAYRPLCRAIEKICTGHSHLAFIKGRGGLGKSFQIRKTLEDYSVKFHEVTGDVTEAYLFRLLYGHNGKVIWFKDVNKILKGLKSMNLLKAATELEPKNRLVSRNSYSSYEIDLPEEFIFTGKIIFDYNALVNNKIQEDFSALVSRGDYIELLITHKEMYAIMMAVAKTSTEKRITRFLMQNYMFNTITDLNLRTQWKAFQTYRYSKDIGLDWKAEIIQELTNNLTPVKILLHRLIGTDAVPTTELKKRLLQSGMVNTMRTADRKIQDWIAAEELYRHTLGERNYKISIRPLVMTIVEQVK